MRISRRSSSVMVGIDGIADRGAPRSMRLHDQAFGRDDDPMAVLAPDVLNAPEPRQAHARLDLDDAVAAFDQGGAVVDLAHHPALDDRRLCGRLGLAATLGDG